jgi:hypothetical protein
VEYELVPVAYGEGWSDDWCASQAHPTNYEQYFQQQKCYSINLWKYLRIYLGNMQGKSDGQQRPK